MMMMMMMILLPVSAPMVVASEMQSPQCLLRWNCLMEWLQLKMLMFPLCFSHFLSLSLSHDDES